MRLKTVDAVLVTDKGRQPVLLSVDDASRDDRAAIIVDGVVQFPDELPAGAYLEVAESEIAEEAALAGFVLERPSPARRRLYRLTGKVSGVLFLVGAVASLVWAVRDVLELDLLGALAWVGLSLLCALGGLYYWFFGEQQMAGEVSARQAKAWRLHRRIGSLARAVKRRPD
jgi:hypothetical protein